MRLVDARRLTGRNFLTEGPGAAVELVFSPGEDAGVVDDVLALLRREVDAVFARSDLPCGAFTVRRHSGGVSVAIDQPVDALDAAADAFELAAQRALDRAAHVPRVPLHEEPALVVIDDFRARLRLPTLQPLLDAAAAHDVPVLWDERGVTLGQGARGHTWSLPPPSPEQVDWHAHARIPVALITGTNGKTTTSRMLASIVRHEDAARGLVVGHTSTDGVVVGDQQIESGDWSGPGGARQVLRDTRVTCAVLETARGGLLRRGLAVTDYDVGVLTNVSMDHFGEFGIMDLEAMADVKAMVGHGVRRDGRVVLWADDERLLARAHTFRAPVVLCAASSSSASSSTSSSSAAIAAHRRAGGTAWFVQDDALVRAEGEGAPVVVVRVDAIPLTFRGAARHNVANALLAAAAAHALGLSDDAIVRGLRALQPTASHVPGRSRVLEHDGVRLLLDFAHNPAGIEAVLMFLHALRAHDEPRGRLIVLTGSAGDRTDDEIRGVARAIGNGGADHVIVRDLLKYLRGRAPGDVPTMMRDVFVQQGLRDDAVEVVPDDVAALDRALRMARRGDTIALLVHVDPDGIEALLTSRGWPAV